jgi:signal transduction histidine kinase
MSVPPNRGAPLARAAAGVLLALFCVAATASAPASDPVEALDGGGVLLLVAPALAAGWSAVAVMPVLTVTSLAAVTYYALGYGSIFAPTPVTVAVFAAAWRDRPLAASAAAAAVSLGAYVAGLSHGLSAGQAADGPLWILAWMLAAFGLGAAVRKRRELLAHERERARFAAQQGAARERLRIARELHDTLTHHVSLINVQASVTAHLMEREPERIPAALETIREASVEALRELRGTVEMLRSADNDPASDAEPSLARLDQLVQRTRAAGLEVTVVAPPDLSALPAEVDRASYRIIQESLTNVIRHAPGSPVRLTIATGVGALTVTVDNDSAGGFPCAVSGGMGVAGMRERVGALGGELRAGRHYGGFRVQAVLPLPDPDPAVARPGREGRS